METLKALLSRRSIRKYTAEPVSDADVEVLLQAAMAAPSAGNEQPWYFVVIRDRERLDAIPSFHPYAVMVKEAPLAILVCHDPQLDKFKGYWEQDLSAAVENLLLAAHARGLGAVWCGVYPEEDRMEGFRKLLGIPENIVPFAVIPVGHPAEEKPEASRFDPQRIFHDRWGLR